MSATAELTPPVPVAPYPGGYPPVVLPTHDIIEHHVVEVHTGIKAMLFVAASCSLMKFDKCGGSYSKSYSHSNSYSHSYSHSDEHYGHYGYNQHYAHPHPHGYSKSYCNSFDYGVCVGNDVHFFECNEYTKYTFYCKQVAKHCYPSELYKIQKVLSEKALYLYNKQQSSYYKGSVSPPSVAAEAKPAAVPATKTKTQAAFFKRTAPAPAPVKPYYPISVVPQSAWYQVTFQTKCEIKTLSVYFDSSVLDLMEVSALTFRVIGLMEEYNSMDHRVCTNQYAVAVPGNGIKLTTCSKGEAFLSNKCYPMSYVPYCKKYTQQYGDHSKSYSKSEENKEPSYNPEPKPDYEHKAYEEHPKYPKKTNEHKKRPDPYAKYYATPEKEAEKKPEAAAPAAPAPAPAAEKPAENWWAGF